MIDRIKRALVPPVLEDENQMRKAKLLNAMLLIILGGTLAGTIVLLLVDSTNALVNLSLIAPIIVTAGALLYIVRQGHLYAASLSLSTMLLITVTLNNWIYDGVRGFSTVYFVVIAVASLLLSERETLIFGALCLLVMVGLYAAEVTGARPFPTLSPVQFTDLFLPAVILCIVTPLLWIGARSLTQALDRSQSNERILAKRTDELAESHLDLEREVAERAEIEQERAHLQQQLIQELSTPIIPLVDTPQGSVIAMPLIGSIDSMRAGDITRALLAGIREHDAQVVIVDITGVSIVDSGVANHLNKTIRAAQLKGARTIVTGISESVAETIVDLGIDWGGIETLSDLQTGLVGALNSLGFAVTPLRCTMIAQNSEEVV